MLKLIDRLYILLFMIAILLPMALFNFKSNQVSEIDNRMLTEFRGIEEFSFDGIGAFLSNLNEYFKDRIGLRSNMLFARQLINDKAFRLLDIYEYGLNGHLFFKMGSENTNYNEYLPVYTNYLKDMQEYCQSHGSGFYFVINPSKTVLYADYLPEGVNYKFEEYEELLRYLSANNVNYIDLAETLLTIKSHGVDVCNYKYDIGHWNMHGAFYGLSAVLEKMNEQYPEIYALDVDEFDISYGLVTKLLVSDYPMHEYVPNYKQKNVQSINVTENLKNDVRGGGDGYPWYTHYENPQNPDGPKLLVFHGSHLGVSNCREYIIDRFSEAVFVHSYYGTISELPYWYNLVQPDIVLYEAASSTITPEFINIAAIYNTKLQPGIATMTSSEEANIFTLVESDYLDYVNNSGSRLGEVTFRVSGLDVGYAYFQMDDLFYDFDIFEGDSDTEIKVTIDSQIYRECINAGIILFTKDEQYKQIIELKR